MQQFFETASLDDKYFGNSLFDYAVTLIIFFAAFTILELVLRTIWNHYRSFDGTTKQKAYEVWKRITSGIHLSFVFFVALYIASQKINLPFFVEKTLSALFIAWVTYQIVLAIETFIDYQIEKRAEKPEDKGAEIRAIKIAHFVIRTIFILTSILSILSVFGVNITSLLAGLGITGIIIAFAAQNLLGDLFSSLTIFLDKPFVIGDFITIGINSGTVEKIGLKTTRLRSTQGEELIISNRDITAARIQNFGSMSERRVTFTLKISNATSEKKSREIVEKVKEIIAGEQGARYDRGHFKSFGDNSLDFEFVYFLTPTDFPSYLNAQQNINLAILSNLEKEKIKLAGNS